MMIWGKFTLAFGSFFNNLMGTIDSRWGGSDCLIGGHFHCPLHQQNSTKTRA